MTELLYLKDAYMQDFEANVTAVQGRNIILDKTAFYPEGGGQPDDRGKLVKMPEGRNFIVRGVNKLGDQIIHEVDEDGLKVGDSVHGWLDADRRYKFMRMHSACHLLSATINAETGALVTGKQIDLDKSKIDFNLENFNKELAQKFIEKANENAEKGFDIKCYSLPHAEAMKIPGIVRLAKRLPPNIPELRIVEIVDLDKQACGGTHVKNTKEIGELFLAATENKGATQKRIYFGLK